MPPPGTGVLSFGLVAIPVRIHTATHSEKVSFHLLHNKCGSRVRNQHYCPVCNIVVERADLVRGFQHAKDQYVPITEEELENLEAGEQEYRSQGVHSACFSGFGVFRKHSLSWRR